jgi:GTP-binding protein YchF
MHIGLVGLPQAGKKTLLRLLTRVDAAAASPSNGVVPGVCPVRDPRVDRLAALYNPKKVTPATIQYLLMPDLTKDSAKNQELFKALLNADVLAAVVRAFRDDTVFHLEGSVDPLRDIEMVLAELILHDLLFIEKRLERIAKERTQRGGADRAKEETLLKRLQAGLNESVPLRTLELRADEQQLLSGTPLLTRKPLLLILNVGEDDVRDRRLAEDVARRYTAQRVHVVQVSAKIEEELAALEDPAERAAFLTELGIAESAIDGLTRVSYDALGLISYFTVGADEVRAWTVRRGAAASEAGRVIHSDIERGFIRAELIKYGDLLALGSEQAVAGAGKAYLKGKDYVVEDGDILNFRFSV